MLACTGNNGGHCSGENGCGSYTTALAVKFHSSVQQQDKECPMLFFLCTSIFYRKCAGLVLRLIMLLSVQKRVQYKELEIGPPTDP